MEADFSQAALVRFLDYVSEKGLLNRSTAQGWKVATLKVLDDLSTAEANDIRKVDVDLAFRRFANRNAGKLSPASLGEYRRRASAAIQDFVQWAENPESYQPSVASTRVPRSDNSRRGGNGGTKRNQAPQPSTSTTPSEHPLVAPSGLVMPYPVRQDFLAQVVIPRDLTVEEAKRLGAFIMTLASDFKPKD